MIKKHQEQCLYKRLLRYRGKRNASWLSVVSLLFLLVFTLQGCTSTAQKSPIPPPHLHLSPSPQPLASSARLGAYLQQLVANGHLSGSVLVAEHGRVFQHAYGFADSEAGIVNTIQTNFRLGSVTKQFTAAAILLLQERGKLHVQDHLCLYVSNCPLDWQPITLHELLTHTSGIPDYTGFRDFVSTLGQHVTPEQLIARFKMMPLRATPGKELRYSNSGYVLLGYIIEKVTGTTYADFLQKISLFP